MEIESGILLRVSGEIGVKKEATQRRMIDELMDGISLKLRRKGISVTPEPVRGKWWFPVDDDEALRALRLTPGVARVAKAIRGPASSWREMLLRVLPEGPISPYFFIYKADDVELSREIKAQALPMLAKLQIERLKELSDVDIPLDIQRVEIGGDLYKGVLYLWRADWEFRGMQGLPYGVDDATAGVLFSGGPDSVLSALMMMRRGVKIELMYMDLGVPEQTDRVFELASMLADITPGGKVSLIVVPWSEYLEKVSSEYNRHTCMVCKLGMLHMAQKIARERRWQFVVSGAIVGEQASQTPYAIRFTHAGIHLPVIYPVAGLAKEDVFEMLSAFDFRRVVERSMPGCPFVPRRVVSKPKIRPPRASGLPLPDEWKVFTVRG